jgi:FixJ family two-component response regulator
MQALTDALVYVVDDDASVREAQAWLLRSRRLPSELFASAQTFQNKLEVSAAISPSGCLLLDVRMPGLSALALFDWLTEREREVMHRVVDGLLNKLIADRLDISVRTVEVHRARVFDTMEVKSAVELANLLRLVEQ